MKNKFLFAALTLLAFSCGAPDKKAELEKLKAERAQLDSRIATLEEDLMKTDTTNSEKKTDVLVTTVKPQLFKTYIEVQGRIDADENVALSTEIPGTITKINVKAGDEVKKGQVLAETDSRAAQQQLAAMQTSMALVNQMYERQKNLWDQKIGTEVAFMNIKAQKEATESMLAAMNEQLRMTRIVSPIDGTVDNVNIKVGQAVAPGVPAINVINFANLKVKADVAESYTSRIRTGNEVLVVFPDMKDSIVSKVRYAARAINPMTRTFNVEVGLDNKKEYHPNMVAKLRINDYVSPAPVIVVPVKYIQKGTSEVFVMVEENGVAVKKVVRIRREYAGMAEIAEGLKEGDRLITEGYDLVIEGDKVVATSDATNTEKK